MSPVCTLGNKERKSIDAQSTNSKSVRRAEQTDAFDRPLFATDYGAGGGGGGGGALKLAES